MEDRFVNLGMYKAGFTKALKKKLIKKGQFQLCYANLALLNQDCKYVLLLVQVFAIDCSNVESVTRNASCVCVKGTVT